MEHLQEEHSGSPHYLQLFCLVCKFAIDAGHYGAALQWLRACDEVEIAAQHGLHELTKDVIAEERLEMPVTARKAIDQDPTTCQIAAEEAIKEEELRQEEAEQKRKEEEEQEGQMAEKGAAGGDDVDEDGAGGDGGADRDAGAGGGGDSGGGNAGAGADAVVDDAAAGDQDNDEEEKEEAKVDPLEGANPHELGPDRRPTVEEYEQLRWLAQVPYLRALCLSWLIDSVSDGRFENEDGTGPLLNLAPYLTDDHLGDQDKRRRPDSAKSDRHKQHAMVPPIELTGVVEGQEDDDVASNGGDAIEGGGAGGDGGEGEGAGAGSRHPAHAVDEDPLPSLVRNLSAAASRARWGRCWTQCENACRLMYNAFWARWVSPTDFAVPQSSRKALSLGTILNKEELFAPGPEDPTSLDWRALYRAAESVLSMMRALHGGVEINEWSSRAAAGNLRTLSTGAVQALGPDPNRVDPRAVAFADDDGEDFESSENSSELTEFADPRKKLQQVESSDGDDNGNMTSDG